MNNTIDLTEKRVFRDKEKEEDPPRIPWKKKVSIKLDDYISPYGRNATVIRHNDVNIDLYYSTNTTSSIYIRHNIDGEDILDTWTNNYTNINYYVDDWDNIAYNPTTNSTITFNKYGITGKIEELDIFGKKKKRTPIFSEKRIPWKKPFDMYYDEKRIPWGENGVIFGRSGRSRSRISHRAYFESEPRIPFVGYVLGQEEDGSRRNGWIDLNPSKVVRIPWSNYVKGEKNPLNSWDLPEDFEDAEIKMPSDTWFLRPEQAQRRWQLGIN